MGPIDISGRTALVIECVCDWRSFCSEVTERWFSNQDPIGGVGVEVEVDETLIVQRKYERGYPSERDLKEITDTPGFKVAVGIHPKGAQGVGETVITQFRRFVENLRVAAVGEVGLDFTVEGTLQQEWVLQKCLQAAHWGKPVVLHIRPVSLSPPAVRGAYSHALAFINYELGPG
ncbi:hydrolase TatD [Elysia marginata]|uniref:Hydrolase TatD n=1 Tax=Elysia marginata TaxID=1093978 RepID=A0AAV4IBX4_9GAST|nr:hydrolase TatD [Elysia marginata]